MKKRELRNLRDKSIEALKKLAAEVEVKLVKATIDFGAGKIKNRQVIDQKRRELAQMRTIIREKELLKQAPRRARKGK